MGSEKDRQVPYCSMRRLIILRKGTSVTPEKVFLMFIKIINKGCHAYLLAGYVVMRSVTSSFYHVPLLSVQFDGFVVRLRS